MAHIYLLHYYGSSSNIYKYMVTGSVFMAAYVPPVAHYTVDADFTIVLYSLCIRFICELRLELFLNNFPHR